MKILLDTRWLKKKPTGIGWYISKLANEFVEQTKDEITFLGGEQRYLPVNFKKIPLPLVKKKLYQGLWKRIYWPKLDFLAGKQDLVHFTNGTAIPHNYPKNIITIHDLAFVEYPEMIEAGNLVFLKKIMPWSIKQATHIITVSQDTKKDLQKHFDVPPEKITVIYNGIDSLFLQKPSAEESAKIRQKYNLPKKILLTVSTIEPRKDFSTLIQGYSLLPKSVQEEYELVIVGSKGWQNEYRKITDLINKLNLKNKIHLLGYVDYKDLPVIYRLASIYIHASIKEGFGIGLVQAMATQLPIVVSNTSCHPEIVKNAGLYFKVGSPEDLADKILQMLDRKSLQQYYITLGSKLVDQYSWGKAAEQTLKLYHQI